MVTKVESLMTPAMKDELVKMARFLDSAFAHILGKGNREEDCPKGYVVFFRYPFVEPKATFPFKPLTRSFFELLGLSPGHLMPSGWRIISIVEEVTKDWEDKFTLEDLVEAYDIKIRNCHFVSLFKRGEPLVLNTDVNDRGWANHVVFVKKTSLGVEGAWLTERWLEDEPAFDFLEPTENSQDKVRRFLEVDNQKRTFVRVKPSLGDPSGHKPKDSPVVSQGIEDSEETMSTRKWSMFLCRC
ncbi:uncharacterized protein LOC110691591 [Chenopodium quinoa]|uniref:uncharacterized protein LOC110691591 n=1 Tax=Chenopodium quinoa TaxID=63459 RepID=UPI000B77230B|nr:uncharacterized protein LOC110691591 [Chenopodium quinoa]XP_021724228.1 uncharacterized protein LOC110691591 [Chenopodium quinoa]